MTTTTTDKARACGNRSSNSVLDDDIADQESIAETEATPEPEGPPQQPMLFQQSGNDDERSSNNSNCSSLSSLPPMPSPTQPLEYSNNNNGDNDDDSSLSAIRGTAMVLMNNSRDTSLFSDESLEARVNRTLNQTVSASAATTDSGNRYNYSYLEPTLEVAKLVQTIELLRTTNRELQEQCNECTTRNQMLERQREELVEAKMTAELRHGESRQACQALQQQLKRANEYIQTRDGEIQSLNAKVEKAETERSALSRDCKESKNEVSSLQRQNEALKTDKANLAHELETTRALLEQATGNMSETKQASTVDVGVQTDPGTSLHVETVNADTTTDQTAMAVDELEAIVSTTVHRNNGTTHTSGTTRDHPSENALLPLGERLCRIKDAAEKASLIREHQREISRIQAEHVAEKKALFQTFETEKDKLLEEAMTEMNAGYKGLRQRLKSEYEEKLEKMERQHDTEMEILREEANSAAASAAAQVTSANQRCQREAKRREALEVRLNQLQKEFDTQKKALAEKHATDLSKLGHGWEAEKKNLVELLQRECNSVFDRSKSASPRSVTTEFFADDEVAQKQHGTLSPLGGDRASAEVALSPTFTELDRTLRETEALVERVLNSNVDD